MNDEELSILQTVKETEILSFKDDMKTYAEFHKIPVIKMGLLMKIVSDQIFQYNGVVRVEIEDGSHSAKEDMN